jgi:uncharacterized LabA/DUF88 family protein
MNDWSVSQMTLDGYLERVIAYVDGYNLYHGLKDKGWKRFYWLDVHALLLREMRDGQELTAVRYFTASGRRQSHGAHLRQQTYLDALRSLGTIDVRQVGKFEKRPWKCPKCNANLKRDQEKQTDVAMATAIIADAYDDEYDCAWVMTADADLVPAVEHVQKRFPEKAVIIIPPRGRRSDELINAGSGKRDIRQSRFGSAQLPDEISLEDGRIIRRPAEWR